MNPKGFIKTLDHTYSRSRRESSWSRFGPLSRCWQHKIREKNVEGALHKRKAGSPKWKRGSPLLSIVV